MATSSKKSKVASQPVKKIVSSKTVSKPTNRKKTAASNQGSTFNAMMVRTKFVFYVVIIAAVLIAIAVGFMTYNRRSVATVPNAPSGQAVMYLKLVDRAATKADLNLFVGVYENSGTQSVRAVQANINYPKDRLQVVSVQASPAFSQEAVTNFDTAGTVRLSRTITPNTAAPSGAKLVAIIQFRQLKNDNSKSQLVINQAASLVIRNSDNKNILADSGITTYSL